MKLLRSKVAEVTPEEEEGGEEGLPESLGARGRKRLQLRDDGDSCCCSQDENPLENS